MSVPTATSSEPAEHVTTFRLRLKDIQGPARMRLPASLRLQRATVDNDEEHASECDVVKFSLKKAVPADGKPRKSDAKRVRVDDERIAALEAQLASVVRTDNERIAALEAQLASVTREREELRTRAQNSETLLAKCTKERDTAIRQMDSHASAFNGIAGALDTLFRELTSQLTVPVKTINALIVRMARLEYCNDLLSQRLRAQYDWALKRLDIECCVASACAGATNNKLPFFLRMMPCSHTICAEDYATLCKSGTPNVSAKADCCDAVGVRCPMCRTPCTSTENATQEIYPAHFESPALSSITDISEIIHPDRLPILRYARHLLMERQSNESNASAALLMRIASLEELANQSTVFVGSATAHLPYSHVEMVRYARDTCVPRALRPPMAPTPEFRYATYTARFFSTNLQEASNPCTLAEDAVTEANGKRNFLLQWPLSRVLLHTMRQPAIPPTLPSAQQSPLAYPLPPPSPRISIQQRLPATLTALPPHRTMMTTRGPISFAFPQTTTPAQAAAAVATAAASPAQQQQQQQQESQSASSEEGNMSDE